MDLFKNIFGFIAVILTFAGYAPYIKSILKKETKPHIYSWSVWLLDGLIIFALQVTHGAGAGAFVTLAAALMSLTVLILAFSHKGKRDIQTIDTVFLILALVALLVWFFAKQPLISTILIMTVDMLGFLPTIRKSWSQPYSENIIFYEVNVLRFILTVSALSEYSLITVLYPGVWLIVNLAFVVMLIVRRSIAKK